MKHEKTYGAIVFLNKEDKIKFLLVKNADWGHWSFPKGRNKKGEAETDTIIREVREEAGLNVKIIKGFREEYTYSAGKDHTKTAVFYLCSAKSSDVKLQKKELTEFKWLNLKDTIQKLTHETNKEILKKANKFIEEKDWKEIISSLRSE